MARMFRRPRPQHAISELNVTNLIDVAFTLLIVFMIATPLINQEQSVPVNLPVESKSSQSKPDKDTVFKTLVIQADGTYLLDNRRLSFAQVSEQLSAYGAQAKQPVIRIRMDAATPAQKFISVMDVMKKNGLSKMVFDTQADS